MRHRIISKGCLALLLSPLALLLIFNGLSAQSDTEIYDLDPFMVQTSDDTGYRVGSSNTATLISIERQRIPFMTSVINEALINDMAIDNVADFARMISGVSVDTNPAIADESGQPTNSFRVRGFASEPLYNGFQAGRISSPEHIGRVEVSKGPNSVLYGQSGGGGVINFIPKAPRFDEGHFRTTVGLGNQAFRRASFDMGGPVSSDGLGEMAFRLGGSGLYYERDQVFFENQSVTLFSAMSWIPNQRVKIDITAEYFDMDTVPSRTAAFVSVGSGPDRVIDPFNRQRNDRNFSYNGPYSNNSFETAVISGYLTAKVLDSLTVRLGGIFLNRDTDIIRYVGAYGLGTSESASSPFEKEDNALDRKGYKLDLLHQAELNGFVFDSIIGYEKYTQSENFRQIRTNPYTVTVPFSRKTRISDWPEPPPLNEFVNLRRVARDDLESTNLRFTQIVTTPDTRGNLLWGVSRGEGKSTTTNVVTGQSDSFDGSGTTYTVGSTYRVFNGGGNEALVFANYSTSFLIQSGNQQDPAIFQGFSSVDDLRDFVNSLRPNAADPEEGKGFEVGARFSFMNNRAILSVAYFDQSRTNIGRTFFVRENLVAGETSEAVLGTFTLASGEENSKGVDVDLDWNVTENLTLTLGAMFSSGKVVSNDSTPAEVGFGLVRSPENMFNAWARYRFLDDSVLQGLTLGLGASYASSTRIAPSMNDVYRISDSYVDVQALIRYGFEWMGRDHSISLNVRNLLDKEWVDEANWLSEPRLFRVHYAIDW